jgi:hypothetical protein
MDAYPAGSRSLYLDLALLPMRPCLPHLPSCPPARLATATPESTRAPFGRRQLSHRPKRHSLHSCYDHLGDPHSSGHPECLFAEIDQRYHQLAPVVAVHGRRRVGQGDPVLERQTGPGPQLAFVPWGDGDAQSGPEEPPVEWGQFPVIRAGQIVPGGTGGGRTRQREPLTMGKPGDENLDRCLRPEPLRQRC